MPEISALAICFVVRRLCLAASSIRRPRQPLRLKLEYDGNNYADDFAGSIKQSSHINVGAVYRVADWADLDLSYERGNTLMFGFTLRTNFNDLRPALRDNPKPASATGTGRRDAGLYLCGEPAHRA